MRGMRPEFSALSTLQKARACLGAGRPVVRGAKPRLTPAHHRFRRIQRFMSGENSWSTLIHPSTRMELPPAMSTEEAV